MGCALAGARPFREELRACAQKRVKPESIWATIWRHPHTGQMCSTLRQSAIPSPRTTRPKIPKIPTTFPLLGSSGARRYPSSPGRRPGGPWGPKCNTRKAGAFRHLVKPSGSNMRDRESGGTRLHVFLQDMCRHDAYALLCSQSWLLFSLPLHRCQRTAINYFIPLASLVAPLPSLATYATGSAAHSVRPARACSRPVLLIALALW